MKLTRVGKIDARRANHIGVGGRMSLDGCWIGFPTPDSRPKLAEPGPF